MSVIVYKSEIISQLERLINNGKKILILEHPDISLLNYLCEEIKKRNLYNMELWHCFDSIPQNSFLKYISIKQMDEIVEIYRMYDFSDKVIVISKSQQYGNLFNYVENGVLTLQEMASVFFSKN